MKNGRITNGSGAAIAALTVMTNGYATLSGTSAGRDAWIAHLLAGGAAVLVALCLVSVCDKYPSMTFFEVMQELLGGFFGRAVAVTAAISALFTCVVSLTSFSRFVQITALSQTPQIIIPLLIVIIAALSLRSGLLAASGSARLLFWFSVFVFAVFTLFGARRMDFSLLMPSFKDTGRILRGTGEVFLNRFGSVAALTAVYTRMQNTDTRRAFFLSGIGGAAAALAIISAITVATLGEATSQTDFYPVYTAMSVRGVGGFIRHTEIVACIAMTLSLFFKCSICLLFADDMLTGIFSTARREGTAMPLALLCAASTQLIYRDISSLREMVEWKSGAAVIVVLYIAIAAALVLFSRIKQKTR